MTTENLIKGLQIIESRRPQSSDPNSTQVGSDEIWSGSLEWAFSQQERHQLEELGWLPNEVYGCWGANL